MSLLSYSSRSSAGYGLSDSLVSQGERLAYHQYHQHQQNNEKNAFNKFKNKAINPAEHANKKMNKAEKKEIISNSLASTTGIFRKPFTLSTKTPLKSSQIKKIQQLLKSCFKDVKEEELNQLVPNKSSIITEKLIVVSYRHYI